MFINNIDDLSHLIDHTLLKPESTEGDITLFCEDALKYGFYSVCINPWWAKRAKDVLKSSNVKVCSVVGFPLGMCLGKSEEAGILIEKGVDEIDMVMAIGAFKSKDYKTVEEDIKEVVKFGKPVKVIIETCLLSTDEIKKACEIVINSKAAFIKTSTGFSTDGAKKEIVKIIKNEVEDKIGIKASGGIRDLTTLVDMVEAGATRIGSSNSVSILNEYLKGQ